jgi:hypothetical protein
MSTVLNVYFLVGLTFLVQLENLYILIPYTILVFINTVYLTVRAINITKNRRFCCKVKNKCLTLCLK